MRTARLLMVLIAVVPLVMTSSCGGRLEKRNNKTWSLLYRRMPLTTEDEPWKMAESLYAFGPKHLITDSVTLERRQTISFLSGNGIKGLVRQDAIGPYFAATVDDKKGELHRNQFIADLMCAPVELTQGFIAEGGDIPELDQFVRRAMVMLDPAALAQSGELITGPDGNELGWTLIMLSKYDLMTAVWRNYKNENVELADLLGIALDRPVNWGSYGGLVEQLGIAVALREYKKFRLTEELTQYEAARKNDRRTAGQKPEMKTIVLTGIWKEAQDHVDRVAAAMERNQVEDGSFSKYWHEKPEPAEDDEELILYTSHALDFLAEALEDDRLEDRWVRRAAAALSRTVRPQRYWVKDTCWAALRSAHFFRRYNERLKNKGKLPQDPDSRDPRSGCCD